MSKSVRVKLIRSKFGRSKGHKQSVEGLGLRKMHQVVEVLATPENLGMINAVNYLLEVEEV